VWICLGSPISMVTAAFMPTRVTHRDTCRVLRVVLDPSHPNSHPNRVSGRVTRLGICHPYQPGLIGSFRQFPVAFSQMALGAARAGPAGTTGGCMGSTRDLGCLQFGVIAGAARPLPRGRTTRGAIGGTSIPRPNPVDHRRAAGTFHACPQVRPGGDPIGAGGRREDRIRLHHLVASAMGLALSNCGVGAPCIGCASWTAVVPRTIAILCQTTRQTMGVGPWQDPRLC
jgi:hypothetical protein